MPTPRRKPQPKIKDLKPAKPATIKGGKAPVRHQANIKFGDFG
jgi:hypothetical protein